MTIQIDSWQEALVFVLTAIAVLTAAASLHWVLFAAPLLKKIFIPYNERLEVVTRILRDKYPAEYERAETDMLSDRTLRGAL